MGFMADDRGNAGLYIGFLLMLAFVAVAWIFFTPAMDSIINIYNGWVGEGWVSQQSGQTMDLGRYAWKAIPAFVILAGGAVVLIRAYILHDGGQ